MLLVKPKLDRRGLRLLAEHLEALRPKNKPTMERVAAATAAAREFRENPPVSIGTIGPAKTMPMRT